MTGSPRGPRDQDLTRVDLGEDLLSPVSRPTPAPSADGPEDFYQSGEILFHEGMLEDAKSYFRKVLVASPAHAGARRRLNEIQKVELDRLLGVEASSTAPRKPVSRRQIRTDQVVKQLDHDLGLQLMEQFYVSESEAKEIDLQMGGLDATQRIDLGIGFLEMGFSDLALRQFRQAAVDPDLTAIATTLEAYTFIVSARPFDATLVLEPLLLRGELSIDLRKEAMYLMGRASEGLAQAAAARNWYDRLSALDPEYRDLVQRRTELA